MTEADDPTTTESTDGRPPWRRALGVVGLVALVLLVLPFVAYAVPVTVGAEHSYVVLSGSMEPTMSPGDVIYVEGVSAGAVEEGDVISFERNGEARPTTHRVVEVVEDGDGVVFRTKGDNNEDPDRELVKPSQVEGRLMSVDGIPLVVPYVGYLVRFAATETGFALFAIVPLVLLVVSEVWNVVASAHAGSEADTEATTGDGREATTGDAPDDDADSHPDTAASDRSETDPDVSGEGDADPDVSGESGAGPAPPEGDDGVVFRRNELRLGTAVLGAFLAYSVVVAYVTVEPWAVGVAASVATAFALLAGLYLLGGGDEAPEPTDGDGQEGESGDPSGSVPTDDADAGVSEDPEDRSAVDWLPPDLATNPADGEQGATDGSTADGGGSDGRRNPDESHPARNQATPGGLEPGAADESEVGNR